MSQIILKMEQITKEFTGVKALDEVSLEVEEGEIHALVGENGAGKSTLMNVLSGVYPVGTYTGNILFKGSQCSFKNIKDSEELGIVIIHQELALIPDLSISENIFLGNEQAHKGVINWNATSNEAAKLLSKVGLNEKPTSLIRDIGVGKQQLVEIAKALSKNVKLLILDEPTAALNDEESTKLLDLLLGLKKIGVTSILISHKLNEVERVADQITIIRDGAVIETINKEKEEIHEERIIRSMVGRAITDRWPKRKHSVGKEVFRVDNWNVYDTLQEDKKVIKDVSFTVGAGEVVGFAGLMGAGRTEIAMSIFGRSYGKKHSGNIYKDGKAVSLMSVSDAITHKIAYVTEDRKNYGLVLINDIKTNISLANLKRISKRGVLNLNDEIQTANIYREQLAVRCTGVQQVVESLSGGNQQKVVLSKWLMTEPDVLLLDEPTRGIDVGAKYEIYTIINHLASEGKGIVMISSELPELLGMCDRIYVINDGQIIDCLSSKEANQETIMRAILRHQKAIVKE